MIEWIEFESKKALKGFPMKDPTKRRFPVYLPPDYDRKRKDPYPVVFFLAGWASRSAKYLFEDSAFSPSLAQQMDEKISNREIPPAVLVFPDCTSKYGCSQYINSPSLGNYMDYLCDELTAEIDSRYHTYRSADFRALLGHSSGGFGSLVTGMLRPDAFRFLCSSAGDSFFEYSVGYGVNSALIELDRAGGVDNFIKSFSEHPNPLSSGGKRVDTMMLLSLAACYAPRPQNHPLYGELFFDPKTGTINFEIFKEYLKWDPVRMIEREHGNLKKIKYILLEAGLQDEYGLQWGHRQFAQKLNHYGIHHEVVEFPGTHSGHSWRYPLRVKKLLDQMLR